MNKKLIGWFKPKIKKAPNHYYIEDSLTVASKYWDGTDSGSKSWVRDLAKAAAFPSRIQAQEIAQELADKLQSLLYVTSDKSYAFIHARPDMGAKRAGAMRVVRKKNPKARGVVSSLLTEAQKAVGSLHDRISEVRLGPIVGNVETIKFNFDGRPYVGKMLGRNRDMVLGHGVAYDIALAVRVLLDGDARPNSSLLSYDLVSEFLKEANQGITKASRVRKRDLVGEFLKEANEGIAKAPRSRKRNPVPLSRAASLRASKARFRNFRGDEAATVKQVQVSTPASAMTVGELDGVLYTTRRDGKVEKYVHNFRKKSRPLLAASDDGASIHIIGGKYEFTERGIVDK